MKKLLMVGVALLALNSTVVLAESSVDKKATEKLTEAPLSSEGEGVKKPAGRIFGAADTDGDGAVSKAEYLAEHENRFAEMDKNGDGKVTKEEGKAAREARKAEMKKRRAEMEKKRAEVEKIRGDAAVVDESAPAETPEVKAE